MQLQDYGTRLLEAPHFTDFTKARTGHDFGTVHVPTFLEKPENVAIVLSLLAALSFIGWKVYWSSWIGHPAIWTTACLAVFFFAASGALCLGQTAAALTMCSCWFCRILPLAAACAQLLFSTIKPASKRVPLQLRDCRAFVQVACTTLFAACRSCRRAPTARWRGS
jgi:hypothetical protein